MKLSSAANDNLIERTRQVWQPRLGRDLSREDARQIVENVTGFFNILAEWSQAEMPRSANVWPVIFHGRAIGHVLRGPQGVEAFNADDKSVGVFSTVDEAAAALIKNGNAP